jgi:hypothetical protein
MFMISLVAALPLLACDQQATSPEPLATASLSDGADVQWQDVFVPFSSFDVLVPCLADGAGEMVTVYGQDVTFRMGTIVTPSGRYHFHNKISNPGGINWWAVSESGTSYQGHRVGNFQWTSDRPYDVDPTPDTPNTVFHLVHNERYVTDTGAGFKLEVRWWFVLNANGEITSDRLELFTDRCF